MTIEQKLRDEYRIGYLDGKEEGLKMAAVSLKGIVEPDVIAERLKMPLEQVMDILNCN